MMFRQGDVLLRSVDKLPDAATDLPREAGRVVLAHGEVTGHSHAFRDPGVCLLRCEGTADRFLSVSVTSDLEHEEHSTIAVPAGAYQVTIQREWTGEISRSVED